MQPWQDPELEEIRSKHSSFAEKQLLAHEPSRQRSLPRTMASLR